MRDVFISHASEDKSTIAVPLKTALEQQRWTVWLDENILQVGDRLSATIEGGLAECRFGVVILSPSFFAKAWPRRELDTLLAREAASRRDVILPIWHELEATDIAQYSETLADRKGISTAAGIEAVSDEIGRVLRRPPPNNIPILLDETVGRHDTIVALHGVLRQARVVTIRGGAGIGKSRVAIEVAKLALSDALWGVWFVGLASLARASATNPNVLPAEIGRVIGVPEQRTSPPLEALAAYLGTGAHLLVLDNCEHLIEACRTVVDHLTTRCQGLRVLATSRVALGPAFPREHVHDLAPLETVAIDSHDVETISANESVRLFDIRAQARSSGFRLEAGNVGQIADLCRALDGIPLSIELAAARLSVQSVEQMVETAGEFVSRLGNIQTGTLRRWDTLTAALEWSLDMLPASAHACARAAAVFEGGWIDDSIGSVWLGDARSPVVIEAMQLLHEHSLVVTYTSGGRKRFRYLEAVRQYLGGRLSPTERHNYERGHAQWFSRFVEEASAQLLQANQREWLDRLQVDIDNIRAALRWAMRSGEVETALTLVASLWRFAEIRGNFQEWRTKASEVLTMPGVDRFPALRSQAHSGAGMLAFRQADFGEAEHNFETSLSLARQISNTPGIAGALGGLGIVAVVRGDYSRANDLFGESLALERDHGSLRGVSVVQFNLGTVATELGDVDRAIRLFAESLRGFRALRNERDSAFPLKELAEAHIGTGDFDAARGYAEESLRIRRSVGDLKGIAEVLCIVGWLEIESADYTAARGRLHEGAKISHALRDPESMAQCVAVIALLRARQENYVKCVRLYAAAGEMSRDFAYAARPIDRRQHDDALERAKAALGDAAFKREWLAGTLLTIEHTVEEVLVG